MVVLSLPLLEQPSESWITDVAHVLGLAMLLTGTWLLAGA